MAGAQKRFASDFFQFEGSQQADGVLLDYVKRTSQAVQKLFCKAQSGDAGAREALRITCEFANKLGRALSSKLLIHLYWAEPKTLAYPEAPIKADQPQTRRRPPTQTLADRAVA